MNTIRDIKTAETYLDILKDKVGRIESNLKQMKAEAKDLDTKMRVVDIADYLGCTRQTVHRKLNDGILPSKKMKDVYEYKNNKG